MEAISSNAILEWHEDTIQSIRREFNLDKPEILNQAIDILEEWVKKQDYFNKKDFSRGYLERRLIHSKGSIERVKLKLDKYCTLRTMFPGFFKFINLKTDFEYTDTVKAALLPKLTLNQHRVFMIKNTEKKYMYPLNNIVRLLLMFIEYITAYDYNNGVILVVDYLDADLLELTKKCNIVTLHQFITIFFEGYGIRVKGIQIISASKALEGLMSLVKPFLSPKLNNLFQVHKNYETVYKIVSKDLLPVDVGGREKPLNTLHDQWMNILASNEFQELCEEMNNATRNEASRQKDKFNDSYMGIPGTFKNLNVD